MRLFLLIVLILPLYLNAQIISPSDESIDHSKSFSEDSTEWLINVATTRRINGSRYSDFVIDKNGKAYISSFEMKEDMQEYGMLYSVSEDGKTIDKNEIGLGRLYAISKGKNDLVFGGNVEISEGDVVNLNSKEVVFKSDLNLNDIKRLNGLGNMTILNIAAADNENFYLNGEGNGRISFGNISTSLSEKGQFIAKINSKNECEWIRPMLNNATISRLECDKNGRVWISGHFFKKMQFCGKVYETADNFDADAFLFALDENGELVFEKTFGSYGVQQQGYRSSDKISFITKDVNGNIHFVGVLDGQIFIDNKPFGKTGFKQLYHGKIDIENLELTSFLLFGESQSNIAVFSIAVDENENLYITGTAINGTIGENKIKNRKPFTCFIVKFDRKMDAIWFKRCENSDATVRCLQIHGDFLWASGHYRNQLFIENQQIINRGGHELFLLKLKK